VGDAWIGATDISGAVVIERKAVADLEASLLDGRYREQRTRLLAFCAEKGAVPMYIIEGELDRLNGRMTAISLQKVLNRLMLRYKIAVWRTDSVAQTASVLTLLHEQYKEDPKVFLAETLSYSDVTSFTKKGNKEDPRAFALAVLQQCPGVSVNVARAILDGAGGSLTAVLATTEQEIAGFKNGTRKVGPAVAKRLYGLFHT
jgi:ERCC4-type nuclease